MRSRMLWIAAGLALAAVVAVGLSQTGGPGSAPRSAASSPAAARRALAGSPPALAALHEQAGELLGGGTSAVRARLEALRGHPIVINKWGAWCGPCRAEFPLFQRAAVTFGRRVAFLGLDVADNHAAATKFLEEFPVTFPSYEDPDSHAMRALRMTNNFPETMYFDAAGRMSYDHQGTYALNTGVRASLAHLEADIRRYTR